MVGNKSRIFDFCLWVTDCDQQLVPPLAKQIFGSGHQGAIIAISDGPVDLSPLKAAGVDVISNDQKIKPLGPKILERNYSQLLAHSTADGFIQVDPDSAVWWLPPIPASDWAGAIIKRSDCIATWGCGTYYSRRLLEVLLSQPIADMAAINYEKGPSRDLMLATALNAAGFFPERWVGPNGHRCVELSFEYLPAYETGKWAITHPIKRPN